MIGHRVRIEYHDQNDSFAKLLPIEGTVSRRCSTMNGIDDWYLVDLDRPIAYQEQIGAHFQFRLTNAARVLIRSRWQDVPIALGAAPSVFLRLVPEGRAVSLDSIDVESYPFVCWCIATVRHAP